MPMKGHNGEVLGRAAGIAGLAAALGGGLVVPALIWPAPAGATGAPAPKITIPKTTIPKTTIPKTTAPKTTAPKTTAPKTTAPKTTAPKTNPAEVSGNAGAIAFYRKVVKATEATDGVEEFYPPQEPLTQARYAAKRLSWAEMQPSRAGFAPAGDIVFVGALRGKVTFVADSVIYAGKGARFPDFGLLLTPKGEAVLVGGAAARTAPVGKKTAVYPCAGKYTGPSLVAGYNKVGVAFGYSLLGHYDALKLVDKAKAYEVTSTYPWPGTPVRRATEVDTVPIATDLPTLTVIHVSAGGKFPAFTMREANVWFRQKLYPPDTNGVCTQYLRGVP
ncbi:MAG: hypothetical protein M1435_04080 [Actinobacteria bacterium]|nr:hypothetical protein [Actinomycetota bacterium]